MNHQEPSPAKLDSNPVTRLFRCSTIEECREIQKGSLIFRRLGRWLALCSIGITFLIGHWVDHFQQAVKSYMAKYELLLQSRSVKWFYDGELPSVAWIQELIHYYRVIDGVQSMILAGMAIFTMRWFYADSFVRRNSAKGFWVELSAIALANLSIYLLLTSR
ncbi:hypothetical protein OJ996_12180 [Luteolibacter sp. GHJ8]|uniref:DUF1634 domain-containing protein n=1 Tax=Luteolibacter rhizosphaerae TaxID=2989719 RepID=A0ABT3G3C4_9BACT|nr:hypothetical protein [Luteolibacter rhizosphaerae]MCW1914338.1 hypothetical protein [Luteolibacter rhizosphaerae]